MKVIQSLLLLMMVIMVMKRVHSHDYKEALSKSILFFECQRSGKLPPNQRITWRKDSALQDGLQLGVDLTGGYYDAGDNVKFNFPMAFSITMLAWSVIEFGKNMGSEQKQALAAIRWGTDYLLKATSVPGFVFVQVGDPYSDHNCWERPEDMDTYRTPYAVSKDFPGSEVSAEIAAAFAASSLAFKPSDPAYSARLLKRSRMVFEFADKYRGSYNQSLEHWVCPFYCDFSGYQDELLWGAAWLFRATKATNYLNYIVNNIHNLENVEEFGWDTKNAGINVLASRILTDNPSSNPFVANADKFVCSLLPESPSKSVSYSPGGLLFKPGGSNTQHATALSFLLLVHNLQLKQTNRLIHCGNIAVNRTRLVQLAQTQVDYILGSNPMKMSYMVGYGTKFPQRIHHRGSTLPSIDAHPEKIGCKEGSSYFSSTNANQNLATGAIVGGPDNNDFYADSRADFAHSEPTTYINAPFVGLLAYFSN